MTPLFRSLYQKGFFHLLSVKFLTQFLGFGSIVVVARFLSPVELGEIRILQSYAMVFSVIATFGLSTSVLKKCSENLHPTEKVRVLRLAVMWGAGISLFIYALTAFLASTGVLTSSAHLSQWLIIYALIIPFAALTDILIAYLQALKRIREMARAQAVIKAQAFILIILSTWIWGFAGFVYSAIAAYVIGLLPLVRHTGTSFLRAESIPAPAGFVSIAVFSLLSNSLSMVGKFADIFILDYFSPHREEIGYYALATLFVFAAMQVTATVQTISTPYLSERATDPATFKRNVLRTQQQTFIMSFAVAAGVYLAGYLLIRFYYGVEYEPMLTYLPILLLKFIIWSAYAVIGIALLGLGLMKYNFVTVGLTTPLGLIISYVFLITFGVVGVAWGQVLTAVPGLLITYYFYRKALKLRFGHNSGD